VPGRKIKRNKNTKHPRLFADDKETNYLDILTARYNNLIEFNEVVKTLKKQAQRLADFFPKK
jgi:hypothetical protein